MQRSIGSGPIGLMPSGSSPACLRSRPNAWTKLTDAMKSGKASEAEKNVFQRALHRLAEET